MLKIVGKKHLQGTILLLFVCVAAYASVTGPDPGYTDAPGDLGNCTACHDHNLLNAGSGSVRINGLPTVYQPGQTYNFTVTTAQSGRIRFGFQLTAIDSTFGRAGTLASADSSTQILPQTGLGGRQYLEHREEGTLASAPGSRTWPLRWTAPDTDIGSVRFFVAGNATNNSGVQDDNDFIYSSSFTADSPTSVVTVQLQSQLGGLVLSAGSQQMVSWNVTGQSNIDNVELRYSTDDGATFPISNKIFFTTDPEVTSFNWTLPNTPTTHGVVRILVGKKSGDAVQVLSPAFTITGDGSVSMPVITGASATGKKLFVDGQNFAIDAVVQVNGNDQVTLNDDSDPSHRLRCKKGAKKIAPGSSATLIVRNPDGTQSAPFLFNRPPE